MLRPVYHGEHGLRTLRELGRSYRTLSQDLNRVMNRIKALYRGWSIPCAGTQGYAPRYREEWLQKIEHAGVRRGAELLYQQLDGLQGLRRTLRPELLAESRKHKAAKLLRQIPCIGPIRAARLIALMQTPHRFRSKRQLWTYSGLGIETRDSAQYRFVGGQLQRAKKPQQIRGLNRNHNHEMKEESAFFSIQSSIVSTEILALKASASSKRAFSSRKCSFIASFGSRLGLVNAASPCCVIRGVLGARTASRNVSMCPLVAPYKKTRCVRFPSAIETTSYSSLLMSAPDT